jgi:adenylate kinase
MSILRKITLLGPPGAGKGTQAKLIADRMHLLHLSTGDILRDEVGQSTALGREAKTYMDVGDLVPDVLIFSMIKERLVQTDGFILDGFPRTRVQAEALETITPLDLAVNIFLPRDEVIRRLASRRVCRGCGKIYNLLLNPPREDPWCDECGEKLVQREDDQPAVIVNRYEVYVQTAAPVLDFYRTRKLLREVDGTQPRDVVLGQILDLLGI